MNLDKLSVTALILSKTKNFYHTGLMQ
jgi:hypothetical protein